MSLFAKSIFVFLASLPAFAQSFDCEKAASNTDKLICTDGAACYKEREMTPNEFENRVNEFFKAGERSPERETIATEHKTWHEALQKCGEGGDLAQFSFRTKVHDCVCKLLGERFDKLRFSKREGTGKLAGDFIEIVNGALKAGGRDVDVTSVTCLKKTGENAKEECKVRDRADKFHKVAEAKVDRLIEILKEVDYGAVDGGLGRQGQQVRNVKCTRAKGARCLWEVDLAGRE